MELFKYISDNDIENVINSILEKNLIKFSQVKDFNDPFELKPSINALCNEEFIDNNINNNLESILLEECKKAHQNIPHENFIKFIENSARKELKNIINNNNFTNLMKNEIYEKNNKYIGILSLTTKKNNLLMWSHYANSHKGFVIEFNPNSEFFNQQLNDKDYLRCLKEVKYPKTRPTKNLVDFDNDLASLYTTKSKEWAYEYEYRMLIPLEEAYDKKNDIYLFKFPTNMIKSIYLGYKMSSPNKEKIITIIKKNSSLKNVKIYESNISDKYYELNFKKL